ncbi:MAG TPA: hypothetical protein VMK13_10105 [Streptosporangiaceae bacterium]|nr:hypothetical protein [Streptosporangiaceae bacterium]
MLRLLDARSGHHTQVKPARPGLLRVGAHLRPGSGEPDRTGVRVLLIADLLARAAELRGLQVLTVVIFPGEPAAEPGFAERAAGLLGIHPPAGRASSALAPAVLGGLADVHITGPGVPDDQLRGLVTRAGAVRVRMQGSADADADAVLGDPLAMRLALMSHRNDHAADIDDTELVRACNLTARWRVQVADWAESPSRPMRPCIRAELDAAFGDLDMPQALQLLTALAREAGAADGARFETFAFADRVLGLELARQVGQPCP